MMGTDDSAYTSKRNIANISRNIMSAGTAPPMRTNLVTKFLLLLAIITFLIYVLADHVPAPAAQKDISPYEIRPAEGVPISAPAPALAPAPAPLAPPTVKRDEESEKGKEVEEEEVSDKRREWVDRNIEKMCNHTVVGWGDKTVMHDILTYLSVLNEPITYLDIGANVGITSLPALLCFKPQHRVIAIEPVKVNYEAMMNSKAGLSTRPIPEERFLVSNVGFSDETKKTKMWIPGRRGDNAALAEKASTTVFKDGLREEEVQVYRGDDFFKMHQAEPKLIKIDVQGSEIRVLRGMKGYLKSHEDLVVMAEHDDRLIKNSGFELYDVYDFMKELGYRIYHKPEVSVKDGEFWVDSDEIDREDVKKIRGDLVFWKSGSA